MSTTELISTIKKNDTQSFLKRMQDACEATNVLWDAKDDNNDETILTVMMILVKKGISFTWLLFNRGMFWDRHNTICPN